MSDTDRYEGVCSQTKRTDRSRPGKKKSLDGQEVARIEELERERKSRLRSIVVR